jgi:hypothetical protein
MSAIDCPETEAAISKIAKALDESRLTINVLEDGSGVVLDVEGERMLTANVAGIAIIEAIAEGSRDRKGVACSLAARFDISESRASEDVAGFVGKVAQGL